MITLLLEFVKDSPPGGSPSAFITCRGLPISQNCFSADAVQREVDRVKAELDKIAEEARTFFTSPIA
jgi:hypothetical protein